MPNENEMMLPAKKKKNWSENEKKKKQLQIIEKYSNFATPSIVVTNTYSIKWQEIDWFRNSLKTFFVRFFFCVWMCKCRLIVSSNSLYFCTETHFDHTLIYSRFGEIPIHISFYKIHERIMVAFNLKCVLPSTHVDTMSTITRNVRK